MVLNGIVLYSIVLHAVLLYGMVIPMYCMCCVLLHGMVFILHVLCCGMDCMCCCIGFAWQGFGSSGATGVASVRSC